MKKIIFYALIGVLLFLFGASCAKKNPQGPGTQNTNTATGTVTISATVTPTMTGTIFTSTDTPTDTVTLTCTATGTATRTATVTPTYTSTAIVLPWVINFIYGGGDFDIFEDITASSDGGSVAVGYTEAMGAGFADLYYVKVDANGNCVWAKTVGTNGQDGGYGIERITGGYIMAGSSWGTGYLVKINDAGTVIDSATYWTSTNGFLGVLPCSDGGFLAYGFKNFSVMDGYIVKVDSDLNCVWSRTIGGAAEDMFWGAAETTDGYVLGGYSQSFSANYSMYMVKVDMSGNCVWAKTYGSAGESVQAYSVKKALDSGYIMAGQKGLYGMIIKVDDNGNTDWCKTINDGCDRRYNDVDSTSDGNYILTGQERNAGCAGSNLVILKTTTAGDKIWSSLYKPTSANYYGYGICQLIDQRYAVAGAQDSVDWDCFVLKAGVLGELP